METLRTPWKPRDQGVSERTRATVTRSLKVGTVPPKMLEPLTYHEGATMSPVLGKDPLSNPPKPRNNRGA